MLAFLTFALAGCSSGPGSITVEVPENSTGDFSVWDVEMTKAVKELASPGKVVELPAGRYTVTRYLSKRWVWAKDVEVKKGKTTTIKLGAILVTPPGGFEEGYSIQDPQGNFVEELAYTGKRIAAPAGDYRITGYLEDAWQWGELSVKAGAVTEMKVGAVKVTVPEGTYDTAVSVHAPNGDRLCGRREFGKPFVTRVGKTKLRTTLDLTPLAEIDATADKVVDVTLGALRWVGDDEQVELQTKDGARARQGTFAKGMAIAVPAGEWKVADADDQKAKATASVTAGAITDVK